jgi:hypothetical protein
MNKSEKFDLTLTMEDAAKIRRVGKGEDADILFLLVKGLTNLENLPKGLTNLNREVVRI